MPIVVPCHRVVRSGGALGGYTGGIERKQRCSPSSAASSR
jgi:O6-methylguanine-DNA--protein-cysteine methyltransferase